MLALDLIPVEKYNHPAVRVFIEWGIPAADSTADSAQKGSYY